MAAVPLHAVTRCTVPLLSQPNACATFNFLTSEKRLTAAGLIPPRGTNTELPALPFATD